MFRKLLIVIFMLGVLVSACSPVASGSSGPMTLTDGLGREVSLDGTAARIVSLTPATTEMLFAAGAGGQVVGRDMFSDYPAEALAVQDVGGSMGEYNLEAIVALQPDLVIAGGINPPELVAALEALGLTVYFLPNPTTLEELFSLLETIGELSGHESEAAELVAALQVRVAAVDEVIAAADTHPTVFYELDATDPSRPYTAGPGTFVDLLIDRAGGENIGARLQSPWAQIDIETLITYNPEIVILGDAAYGETPERVATRLGWDTLAAVQTGQVFPFDDNLVSRPGPRLVDGLEALARILHPELFE
ncbi:MAG: cobalamin-binding protein [Chloroflexota bacterium]